jgi:hypothetical protein
MNPCPKREARRAEPFACLPNGDRLAVTQRRALRTHDDEDDGNERSLGNVTTTEN